jgi:CubicO group peptidase (beta-lactamase class C family)
MLIAAALLLQIAARADSVARSEIDSGFTGVVLVARGDSVLLHRAYGAPNARRVTARSAFNVASITKSFTAAAILILRDARRLSLGDSIARFFPRAPIDKRAITIRQLLTHTSGLPGNYTGGGINSRDEAVRSILAKPLQAPPGTRYEYQDDDYELLAAVIEVVTHGTWQAYLRHALFRPAHLRHTAFQGTDWGHRGANGITSTAGDLLLWVRAVRDPSVFGPELAQELGQPLIFVRRQPPCDIHYGYGTRIYVWAGRVAEIMYSGSGDDGQTSIARVLPDGTVVIVLASSGAHGTTTWASYVAQQILPRCGMD